MSSILARVFDNAADRQSIQTVCLLKHLQAGNCGPHTFGIARPGTTGIRFECAVFGHGANLLMDAGRSWTSHRLV